jgi:hypothetical protein
VVTASAHTTAVAGNEPSGGSTRMVRNGSTTDVEGAWISLGARC